MWNITAIVSVLVLMIGGIFGISIQNGIYKDVNIVIKDSVEESDDLLERIKDIFTRTSQMLFESTRHHVYFGQINIILPKAWTKRPEFKEVAARSELENYITIETGKTKCPHTVRKVKKCGHPGHYIYLHRDFVLKKKRSKWGRHENVLVHEWGHLRWGLFDEYNKKKRFYQDNGVWTPTGCSKQVKGTVGLGLSCRRPRYCDVKNTGRNLNKKCRYCVDDKRSNMSSIMAYNSVDGISMFCDNENDTNVPIHQRHNSKAPTKQNDMCKGRSAWEVMRDHPDFQTDRLPSTTNTTPEFNIVTETTAHRVFVLDVSGSMDTDERIETLYQASKYVIENKIPEGSWLGIVWFSGIAVIMKNLTRVESQDVRNSLVDALPQITFGMTCIGCGIELALQIFDEKLTDLTGCEIIVISDGKDNDGDIDLNSAVEHAANESVTIHSISISQQADERMISMAQLTGGVHISFLEQGITSFASLFMEIISSGITEQPSITLVSETVDSSASSPFTFTFELDNGIGNNTAVGVLQKNSTLIEINVTSPNGTVYTRQQTSGKSLVLKIPGVAGPGKYNVSVEAETPFDYFVTSNPSGTEAVRVDSWISPTNYSYSSGELPVIEADVRKGGAGVLNANVMAVIGTDRSTACNIPMLDDGNDPDDKANDGTYAAVIPRHCIKQNGRLTTNVYAQGGSGKASVLGCSNARAESPDSDEDTEVPEILEDSFQRVSLLNEIFVSHFSTDISNKDITPPGRITDVDVIDISTEYTKYGEKRNFTIKWTAPGDDFNIGQATSYELKIADDIHTLLNNFSAAKMLDVVNANYTPKASGETEYIRIEIDAEETYTSTSFFAVRATDKAGNVGDVSNIVSILVANGYRIKAEGTVDFQYSPTEDHAEDYIEDNDEEDNAEDNTEEDNAEDHAEDYAEDNAEDDNAEENNANGHAEDHAENHAEEHVEDPVKESVQEPVTDNVKHGKEEVNADLTMLVIGLSCAATAFVGVIIAVVLRVKKSKTKSITLIEDCENGTKEVPVDKYTYHGI